jgi:putative MATE family efflux protein
LDPCLINGWGPFPKLGVLGAAVATTTGRGIGVLFQLWSLGSGTNRIIVTARQVRLNLKVMWHLLTVSIVGIIQFLIVTASWVALVRIISAFGSAAVAGYTIGVRIIIFTILPAWGLSNAAATLVGQNLGAKKPERAQASVYRTGLYNMLYMGALSVILFFFPVPLAAVFTSDPAVAETAVACLRFVGLAYVSYAWGMVFTQAFNGAGDTVTPTVINFIAFWLVQLPVAYLLGVQVGWGPRGVFSAVPIADVVFTITAFLWFRRGAWKLQKV